jgi:hypothetical protein
VCYFLYMASPLTLSEVRSMLPSGLAADLASTTVRAALQKLHPSTRTVARLLVGGCSCDLVRPRQADPIEDERELRARYRRGKLPRAAIIRELERHRLGPVPRPNPPDGWSAALARFVVEHARNAGPTLYLLDFEPQPSAAPPVVRTAPKICSAREVGLRLGGWMEEGTPALVS